MPEWEIIIDDEERRPPRSVPTEPPEPVPSRSKWLWLGLIAAVLVGIGLLAIREQRRAGQSAIRRDLSALIVEEETVRLQGQPERAADFAIANAPPAWAEAYRRTFTPDPPAQTPEIAVEIENLDFDGTCAVVDVTIDGLAQVRAYCLQATQWRRAPVLAAAWSEWQTVTVRPGLRIRFAARDQELAQTLAADAAKLLDHVEAYWPDETDTKILIEPHDLRPPLIASEKGRIRLNSPRLLPPGGPLSPSEAVRLASAEALLRQVSSIAGDLSDDLPNRSRFSQTIQTVIAAHLVLPAPPPLPLTATLQTADEGRAVIHLPDQTAPVAVDLPNQISASDGSTIPPGCLPPGSTLTLDGEWREVRRSVRATQVTVNRVRPLDLEPTAGVAYIVSGEPFEEQAASPEGRIYPGTRSYLQARRARVAQALLAMDQQGQLQPLTPLSETLRVFPLPASDDHPHFLFQRRLAGCEGEWLIHYEPPHGVRGHWLAPDARWVWRSDLKKPLFFERRADNPGDNIYQATGTFTAELIGRSNASMFFLGWHLDWGQLIATNAWFGEMYLGPLAWATGYIDRSAHPSYRPLREARLSPDGRWMAHLGGLKNMLGPADRLDVLDLERGTEMTLLEVEAGQGVGAAIWSLDVGEPARLALLSGPINNNNNNNNEDGNDFVPLRLLVLSPDSPGEVTVVAEATAGEQLTTPVFCADGSLLYRSRQAGRYRLYHHHPQQPNQPPTLLLEEDRSFWPLGC